MPVSHSIEFKIGTRPGDQRSKLVEHGEVIHAVPTAVLGLHFALVLGFTSGVDSLAENPPAVAQRSPFHDPYPAVAERTLGDSPELIRRYGSSAFRRWATRLEYSPDGRWLAAARGSNGVSLINARTGEAKFDLVSPHPPMQSFAFSPDGQSVALYDPKGVMVWDFRSGNSVRRSSVTNTQPGSANFQVFATSLDRKWRTAWNNPKSEIIIAQWDQFEPVHRIPLRGVPRNLVIGKDGKWVAASDYSHPLGFRLWKAPKFDSPADWKAAERKPIESLAGSPDGQILYVGFRDGTIQAWNIERGQDVSRFSKVSPSVDLSLVPSPDGKLLAAATRDAAVIYETATGRAIQSLKWERQIPFPIIAFSPDSRVLAVAAPGRPIELWDVKTGQVLYQNSPAIEWVFATKDRRLFGSRDGAEVLFWNRETGELEKSFPSHYRPNDGSRLIGGGALQGTEQLRLGTPDDEIYYRDLASGETFEPIGRSPVNFSILWRRICSAKSQVATLHGPGVIRLHKIDFNREYYSPPTSHLDLKCSNSHCLEFMFSEDGTTFAAVFADRSLFVWEPEKGTLLQQFELDAVPGGILLNANGQLLAAFHENSAAIWDLKTGKRRCRIPEIETSKLIAAFGYQDSMLAFTRPGEPIHIWNVESGKEVLALPPSDSPAKSLAWSRDNKQLAVGLEDKSIRLLDLQTKKETARLEKHLGVVTHLLFHRDGKRLISASNQPEIGVWDVSTGKPIRIIENVRENVLQLAVSADGRRVLVNSLFDAPFHLDIDQNRSIIQRITSINTPWSPRDFAYSQERKLLALACEPAILCMDLKTGRELPFVPVGNVTRVQWASDGRTLIASVSPDLFGWDVKAQKEVYRITAAQLNGNVSSMTNSPDGQMLAVGSSNGDVTLWDPKTGRLIREFRTLSQGPIQSLQFSSDGRLLFVLAFDAYFIIEVESGLFWYKKPIASAADRSFAQVGPQTLLSAEAQGPARLWTWAPEVKSQPGQSLENLWKSLSEPDGPTVYRSMFALAERKDETVKFLAQKLQKVKTPPASPEEVASLIKNLEDASPVVRRQASEELRKFGQAAHPHLEAALKNEDLSRQVRTRIQLLLPAESVEAEARMSMLRAIQLLEWIATPQAKKVLGEYAASADQIGIEAQAALDRLSQSSVKLTEGEAPTRGPEKENDPITPMPSSSKPTRSQEPENDIDPMIRPIKNLGGKQLVADGAKASFSHDGQQIVYSKMPFGAGIKLLNHKTGETTTVVESGKDPAFSPGKTPLIAYVRGDGQAEEVWLVQPDGKQDRKLGEGGFPTWSKDGKTLYFHSRKRRMVLSVDLTALEPTPKELKDIPAWYPAVSPEGKSVATVYPAAFVIQDFHMGRDIVNRLPGFTRGGLAGWSADGTQVGYGGFGYDDRVGLWIYDVQSGKSKKILDGPCTMPAWSPDGSKLVFDFRPDRNRHEIWMIETKSLEKRK